MTMTREQEILQNEEQFLNAKRALDIDALDRIYGDDVVVTGVLGEPICSKTAIIDEAKRGLAERRQALASGQKFEASAENDDIKVTTHGDTAIATYRFVVNIKGSNFNVHRRYRTTNVWVKRDGRWQIVAAHLAFVLDAKQAAMLSGEAQ
jgi:ketosteroid isomerase-like protein